MKKKRSFLIPPAKVRAPRNSKKFLWIFLIFAIVIGSIYTIFFTQFFIVQSFEIIEDGSILEQQDLLYNILREQKGKNLIFINEDEISSKITKLHPDIKKIEVKKIFPKKINVTFEKHPIVANFINLIGDIENDSSACKSSTSRNSAGIQKKFLIESIGFLSEENVENANLPYIKMATVEAIPLNSIAISEQKLTYILNAITLFKEKFDIKVIDVNYKVREREIRLCTDHHFEVWIDIEKDLNEQLNKLKKALPKVDIYNRALKYIDLRIQGNNNEKFFVCPIGAKCAL